MAGWPATCTAAGRPFRFLRFKTVLECAHAVVALPNRLISALNDRAAFAGHFVAAKRRFEFFLEIVFAALDLVQDSLVVASGDRRFEVEPGLVKAAHRRSV